MSGTWFQGSPCCWSRSHKPPRRKRSRHPRHLPQPPGLPLPRDRPHASTVLRAQESIPARVKSVGRSSHLGALRLPLTFDRQMEERGKCCYYWEASIFQDQYMRRHCCEAVQGKGEGVELGESEALPSPGGGRCMHGGSREDGLMVPDGLRHADQRGHTGGAEGLGR